MKHGMRITIFNVKFSANLGDGCIAECLEHGLASRFDRAVIKSIDLSGRSLWSAPTDGRSRAAKLKILQWLPCLMAHALVTVVLGIQIALRQLPRWRGELAACDFAVFGGGQLIQDGDLNFPLKLAAAAHMCRVRSIPMGVFSIGAAPLRSRFGRFLLGRLLDAPTLKLISARDELARRNLEAAGCRSVDVCRDPGLLSADVWPAPSQPNRQRPLVGLNVIHGAVLAHHSSPPSPLSEPTAHASATAVAGLFAGIIGKLSGIGYDVVCFTNGAAEDELLLAELERGMSRDDSATPRVRFAARAQTPGELARLIAACDVIVAHRLHASIIAYSYRVPHIGLRWDDKLEAFYASVGRAAFIADFNSETIERMPEIILKALEDGVDRTQHQRVLSETRDGLDRLAHAIRASAATVSTGAQRGLASDGAPKLAYDSINLSRPSV